MISITLFEPEIAPNTGNVIRLCANIGASLHLIHPLGFSLDDAKLRRAGLDYRDLTCVSEHVDWSAYIAHCQPTRLWAFTTKASRSAFEVEFGPDDVLVFGPETRGLPQPMLDHFGKARCVRLPMTVDSRSLNLSNAVAIAAYEAWRQLGFYGAAETLSACES